MDSRPILSYGKEEENRVTKKSEQIRSQAANKEQELTSKVELLQLLSLSWRTAISTSPFCCAHAMTMPCARSRLVKKKKDK